MFDAPAPIQCHQLTRQWPWVDHPLAEISTLLLISLFNPFTLLQNYSIITQLLHLNSNFASTKRFVRQQTIYIRALYNICVTHNHVKPNTHLQRLIFDLGYTLGSYSV